MKRQSRARLTPPPRKLLALAALTLLIVPPVPGPWQETARAGMPEDPPPVTRPLRMTGFVMRVLTGGCPFTVSRKGRDEIGADWRIVVEVDRECLARKVRRAREGGR